MHADELTIDASLVRRLLAAQFPQWADLPLAPVRSAGTDNAIFRLGASMAVRLPRIHWAVDHVEKEQRWLPQLAPHLPLKIPVPLALGAPAEGYPWPWSVYSWLEGENLSLDSIADPVRAAKTLAAFILALQRVDPSGGPRASDHGLRGAPLGQRDRSTREAIAALSGMIDARAATAVWEAALQAAEWDGAPVWFHGDLLPGNLLFAGGHLRAVIDFGGLGVGDPACDLMSAWGLLSGESRAAFRTALGVGDATWQRGRGHALSQALIFIPYYLTSNPLGVSRAKHMIDEVLSEFELAKEAKRAQE